MVASASTNPLNFAIVSKGMKDHYQPLRVRNMVYKNNPFLGLVPKYTDFGGKQMPIPLRYTDPQRRSADFATGQANTSTSGLEQFVIQRIQDYSFAYIDGETMQASAKDKDSFVRYLTMEVDGALNSLTRSLAVSLYRDGSGSLSSIAAAGVTAGTADTTGAAPSAPGDSTYDVLALANTEDVTNFEVGMSIVAAATNGTAPGTAVTIVAVDRANGTISINDPATAIRNNAAGGATPAILATYLLFQKGDYMTAGARRKVTGLDGWLPATVPASGDSHFGVDRSTDATRLGGIRFDGSSMPIEEALMEAAASIARDGGSPDTALCDYRTYVSLEKSLGARVRYNTVSAPDADIGFSGIELVGPSGSMRILPDLNCIPNTVFLLQMDTWQLASLNAAPQFLDADSNRILRDAGADAYECRLGYYAQLACFAPGYNCRITLS